MDTDDLEPQVEKPKPMDLNVLSIEALGNHIEELEAEIARAREAIAAKRTAHDGAESVFKS